MANIKQKDKKLERTRRANQKRERCEKTLTRENKVANTKKKEDLKMSENKQMKKIRQTCGKGMLDDKLQKIIKKEGLWGMRKFEK